MFRYCLLYVAYLRYIYREDWIRQNAEVNSCVRIVKFQRPVLSAGAVCLSAFKV